ncbi:MAG: hypothetical protein QXI60_11520, partial [Thermofilaceae archaeon]
MTATIPFLIVNGVSTWPSLRVTNLEVLGTATVRESETVLGRVTIKPADGAIALNIRNAADTADVVYFLETGDGIVTGNLGIGVAPAQKLHINQGHYRYEQIPAPPAPTVAVNPTPGNLNGTYYYRITFVNAVGETETGAVSAAVNPVNQQVDLSNIPIGPPGTIARRIYRTTAGGPPTLMRLVTTINDNTTTTYTDNVPDTALGANEPRVNTTGGIIYNGSVRVFAADPAVTILGYNAGRVNAGYSNTFIGMEAGYSNTTGYSNTFIGTEAGRSNTTGYSNTFIGTEAGRSNTTGSYNTFIGTEAGCNNTTGYSNTFIGRNAGYSNTTGYSNTFI